MENFDSNIVITLDDGKEDALTGIYRPLYQRCYGEAFSAIVRNIEYNKKEKEERKKREQVLGGSNRDYIEPLAKSNIITFIGNRGSGKTSVLNEFCCLLRNYHKLKDNEVYQNIFYTQEDFRFHVLGAIDASVLGREEDLIEVILASMYQDFSRRHEEDNGRSSRELLYKEILQGFDQVYKDYDGLKRKDVQPILGDSVLVKLRNISSSLKTRAAFDSLVRNLLKYLGGENGERESYLVIVIDDLDMNPENGFEMLELVHKYLENKRVIILAAIKYEQMCLITQRHFTDESVTRYGSIHSEVFMRSEKAAKDLCNDYLLKVLPLSNRIYLPEWEELSKHGYVSYPYNRECKWDIKEFTLMRIAEKMDIYYDAMEFKKHFSTPSTVRRLVSYNSFLDALISMEEIRKAERKAGIKLYNQNHDRFNKDIEKRMAIEALDNEQLEQFQAIIGRHINRRAEYAVNFLRQWTEGDKKGIKDEVDSQEYCYMDLLEALYNFNRRDYYNRPLVDCILASFTSDMTREYFEYKSGVRECDAKDVLKCFLGKTFGGNWFSQSELLNVSPDLNEIYRIPAGYLPRVEMQNQEISFRIDVSSDIAFIDSLSDLVCYMKGMVLLFSDFTDQQGRRVFPAYHFERRSGDTEDGEQEEVKISIGKLNATFDAFGFIGKEIRDENGAVMYDMLMKMAKDYIEYYCQRYGKENSQRLEKELWNKLKARLAKKKIYREGFQEAVFPFYNLDMSYNVMKRVRRKIRDNASMAEIDIYNYYRNIYGYIAGYLKEEEAYYRKAYIKADKEVQTPKWHSDFVSSFFIQTFGYNEEGQRMEDFEGENFVYQFFVQALDILMPLTTIARGMDFLDIH